MRSFFIIYLSIILFAEYYNAREPISKAGVKKRLEKKREKIEEEIIEKKSE